MSKNESFPRNIKYKKIETRELKKVNIKKIKNSNNKKKVSNSFARALKFNKEINQDSIVKNINEKLRKKSNNAKINLSINLSKKLNNCKSNIKDHKATKNNIKTEKTEEIKVNNKRNSSKKDRYLNCFENSISSKNIEENKINVLLNDFTISSGNKNKENINIQSNLQSKNNKITNYLIKVNKNNNFQTKNCYIEACEKLKEKIKNNIDNQANKKIENESPKAHIFKISSKNMERKRNTTGYLKKRYIKKNTSVEENNNSTFKNNCISIDKAKKLYNSFINQKKLFLKNNHLRKNQKNFLSYIRINTENNKSKNKTSFQCQEKSKIKEKMLTEIPPIMNYEQRKIKVIKNKSKSKSPKRNLINDIKDKNLTMQVEKNKINIEKIINIKSPIKEEIFRTLSFKNEPNCHSMSNSKNAYDNFSLDVSLKNINEKIENNNNNQILVLSPVNSGRINHKRVFSLKKKRYIKKLSKKNLQTENFDFEELNKRLFKMIRNIENHEAKKATLKLSKSKKDEEGFIKWDNFEKIIKDN